MRLLELRKETEEALGAKFNAQRLHDFILAQGLLPPGLMKKAVDDHFIPERRDSLILRKAGQAEAARFLHPGLPQGSTLMAHDKPTR
jgi:hypothetical protein